MQALTIPSGKWLPAAGASGRRTSTSAGVTGEAAGAGSPCVLVSQRAPSGIQRGSFSPVLSRRGGRTAATVVPALSQRSPAFSSAEKPEKAETESETSKSTQTADELLQTASQIEVAEIENQTVDQFPTEEVKTQSSEVVQIQTPTDELLKGDGAEVIQIQTATDELLKGDTEIETTHVETQTLSEPLQANTEVGTVQVQAQIPDVSRTVDVKFMLQKSCKFGEQFLVVGEIPILGSWDPDNAKPLRWSEGHVWTVEMTLPAGEDIEFKFILKTESGKIKWQPGPNRVLQTGDATNTIVVTGDWEDAVDLKIAEGPLQTPAEGEISEESKIDGGAPGEDVIEKSQVVKIAEGPLQTPAEGETSEESKIDGGTPGEDVIEKSQVVITTDENGQKEAESSEVKPTGQEGDPVLEPSLGGQKEAEFSEVNPTGQEGDPVLEPSLGSVPLTSTQGASSSEEVTHGIADSASWSTSGELGSKTSEVIVL